MKTFNNCKIVQDLLPNYIEKMTDSETNKYIEHHIDNCQSCQTILNNMTIDISSSNAYGEMCEIQYIKKFKNKMNRLKFILAIICLFIIVLFLIFIGKKFFILLDISNKSLANQDFSNFHIVQYYYYEGSITKMEQFKLNNKNKFSFTMETADGFISQTIYKDENSETTYLEKNNQKYVQLNTNLNRELVKNNVLYSHKLFDILKYSISAHINTTTFRGKECYYLNNLPTFLGGTYERVYMDKSTGLMIGSSELDNSFNSAMPIESVYEYNTVTNNDFIQPDISEYKVVENFDF